MTASETFSTSLKEAKNYFSESFPYLNRISLNITTDVREQMHYIKEIYKKDTTSKISAFEIEEMQDKINSFIWENSFELK